MAERRMFNKTLLFSNRFALLPKNAQLLYLFLNLQADDDGICSSASGVCRLCGCGKAYLERLIEDGWVLAFEEGEVAITHWHIHNQLRKDRYKPSLSTHVTRQLKKGEDGCYVKVASGCQNCAIVATEERIAQRSPEKQSLAQSSIGQHRGENSHRSAAPGGTADTSSSMPPEAAEIPDEEIYQKILKDYQILCGKRLKPCERLTPKLRRLMGDRLAEGYTPGRLITVFAAASMSEFLAGRTDDRWQAGLEWLLDPNNIRRVEAGQYTSWNALRGR